MIFNSLVFNIFVYIFLFIQILVPIFRYPKIYISLAYRPLSIQSTSSIAQSFHLSHRRNPFTFSPLRPVGYVLGLACTLVSLQLMRRAQPAILYLAPCVLGCIYAVSTCRGQTCLLLNPKVVW